MRFVTVIFDPNSFNVLVQIPAHQQRFYFARDAQDLEDLEMSSPESTGIGKRDRTILRSSTRNGRGKDTR
ncbi:hypothetical protein BDP27DRAFT_1320197 [Rhodocollybia butyracea]|uniref:Uncharacterized protein n=1 Tax=Rhodocollybia butyracea TaxID=206335 RepID=A0A9P5PZ52_9AGAR|nr:hypothetical protein BDP27DRAFT_1320197 [Rhodocollybia butyracea]